MSGLACPHCGHEIRRAPIAATRRQRECLDLIASAIASTGQPPSFRAIAAAMGITSRSGVGQFVKALRERGLIEDPKPRHRHSTLALTEHAWSLYRHAA